MHLDAVDDEHAIGLALHDVEIGGSQDILDSEDTALDHHADITLLPEDVELRGQRASGRIFERGQNEHLGGVGQGEDIVDDIRYGMPLDLDTGNGREGVTYTGVEKFKILIYFGLRADGRARVGGVDLLFDGHSGRETMDIVDIGLGHASEKLPGIRAEALDVATLSFSEERVESQ